MIKLTERLATDESAAETNRLTEGPTVKLTERLSAIAALVPPDGNVADIGTDHGLLPCYLAQQNAARRVIACDIGEGPLEAARRNIQKYGLERQVSVRRGDGLRPLAPKEADVAVIAGMGGSLMLSILEGAPEVADALRLAILQPNTGAETVRRWAVAHDWRIAAERLVYENDRFAVIIALAPHEGQAPLSEAEYALGPLLLAEKHPLLPAYAAEDWQRAARALASLAESEREESCLRARALRQKWETINEVILCRFGVRLF